MSNWENTPTILAVQISENRGCGTHQSQVPWRLSELSWRWQVPALSENILLIRALNTILNLSTQAKLESGSHVSTRFAGEDQHSNLDVKLRSAVLIRSTKHGKFERVWRGEVSPRPESWLFDLRSVSQGSRSDTCLAAEGSSPTVQLSKSKSEHTSLAAHVN